MLSACFKALWPSSITQFANTYANSYTIHLFFKSIFTLQAFDLVTCNFLKFDFSWDKRI